MIVRLTFETWRRAASRMSELPVTTTYWAGGGLLAGFDVLDAVPGREDQVGGDHRAGAAEAFAFRVGGEDEGGPGPFFAEGGGATDDRGGRARRGGRRSGQGKRGQQDAKRPADNLPSAHPNSRHRSSIGSFTKIGNPKSSGRGSPATH